MISENQSYEDKSQYLHKDKEKFELIKTLVAFANTEGGTIVLNRVSCDSAYLDSSRLDDQVNKYVQPRIQGISSSNPKKDQWLITVPKSPDRPHIFVHEASYADGKRKKSAFYPGQIYVRHGSKTEPATADDIRNILQNGVALWLSYIAASIHDFSIKLDDRKEAIPFRLDKNAALTINIGDPNTEYPYTAKIMGEIIGRNQNWTSQACKRITLKDNPRYCLVIKGSDNKSVIQRRYNNEALEVLRHTIKENPKYDPYH